MNEQEKALQGMIEFCQWLIPNAKQLGLEQSKSMAMISQAQTPDDIVNGMNSLYEEIGEEQFTALTQAFQQSKQHRAKMAKNGAKIDYLVNKFATGGPHNFPWKPQTSSIELIDMPHRKVTHRAQIGNRERTWFDDGMVTERATVSDDLGRYERFTNNRGDTMYTYYPGGNTNQVIRIGPNPHFGYNEEFSRIPADSVEYLSNRINELLNR